MQTTSGRADTNHGGNLPRVLLLGPALTGGGAEKHFALLARHLFAGQTDVAVLSGATITSEAAGCPRCLHLGWRGKWSYAGVVVNLIRLLRKGRYQAIICFGMYPGVVGAMAMLLQRKPPLLVAVEITRPKLEIADQQGWRRLLYRLLRQWHYRRARLLTANSQDGLHEMCQLAGVASDQGQRLVNVIEWQDLEVKAAQPPEHIMPPGRYLICLARLDAMKRVDTIIEALSHLPAAVACRLLIIGDGAARQQLASQAQMLGLADQVIFAGWLDNPAPLLQKATALVLASSYEGFSNAVLEAMFLKVPVITSLCSSDAEQMCAEGAALGFSVGDSRQLARHVEAICTDTRLVESLLGQACRYRQPHALENAISVYEQVILTMLRLEKTR